MGITVTEIAFCLLVIEATTRGAQDFFGFLTGSRPLVLGGVEHSDSLQQPHLRLFVTLTILPLLCRLPVGSENAETVLDHRIRANPQFSVIRRKRHVARTERGNRKSTKKRTRIKTSGIRHHTAPAGMPGNFWGQLPCRIPRSSLCFSSPIRIMRLKS